MNKSTRIFLLRHGQTEWNTQRRLQGHKDSALTEIGREQAHANGLKLMSFVDKQCRLVSSPLGRCRETSRMIADAIAFDASRIEYEDRVKELSYGRWEGQKMSDIQADDKAVFESRLANRWDVPAPGGESYSMVAQRLRSWLHDVEGQTLVLVSHSCAGRILRGIFSGIPREEVYSLEESHDAIYLLEHNTATRIA